MPQYRIYASHAARQAAYRKRRAAVRTKELEAKGLPSMPAIPSIPATARWDASLALAIELAEQTVWEMGDYFDARTEVWQDDLRGQELKHRIHLIDSAIKKLREANL